MAAPSALQALAQDACDQKLTEIKAAASTAVLALRPNPRGVPGQGLTHTPLCQPKAPVGLTQLRMQPTSQPLRRPRPSPSPPHAFWALNLHKHLSKTASPACHPRSPTELGQLPTHRAPFGLLTSSSGCLMSALVPIASRIFNFLIVSSGAFVSLPHSLFYLLARSFSLAALA